MIKLENVSKYYNSENTVTLGLHRINLEFHKGEFIAITGESGSGKSTLINVISGFDTYEDGEIFINKEATSHYDESDWEKYRKDSISFIFQNYNLIDSYTVLHNVEVAMIIQGMDRKTRRKRALEILDKVGLSGHLRHKASKLSGGQKQRLAIARALAKDTPIIIADEPTGNLDSDTGNHILKLLNEVSKDKLVIVVTHNYDQVEPFVTRKIRMFDGEVAEDVTFQKVDKDSPLLHLEDKKSSIKHSIKISILNIIEQPKKTSLLLFITLTTIIFVFVIFGTFLSLDLSTPEDSERVYSPYRDRVVVARKDGEALTEYDYKRFSKMSEVDYIVKEDLGLDIKLEANFRIRRNLYGDIGFISYNEEFDDEDIIGRYPTRPGEILVSAYVYPEDIEDVEERLNINYKVNITFGQGNKLISYYSAFKIVGIHLSKIERTKYVITEKDYQTIYNNIKLSTIGYELYVERDGLKDLLEYQSILPDSSLENNEVYFADFLKEGAFGTIYLDDKEIVSKYTYNTQYEDGNLYVSPQFYKQLLVEEDYQYSLFLKNYRNVDSVVRELLDEDYNAFSPYLNQITTEEAIFLTASKLVVSIIIFIAILIIYLIAYLIIKAIMTTKIRDYTILKTVGIETKSVIQIIRIEIIGYFLISYAIFFILYLLLGNIFNGLMNYYIFSDYILISLITLGMCLLISRRFIRLLNKKSIISNLLAE